MVGEEVREGGEEGRRGSEEVRGGREEGRRGSEEGSRVSRSRSGSRRREQGVVRIKSSWTCYLDGPDEPVRQVGNGVALSSCLVCLPV